jgi:hypothetical protein
MIACSKLVVLALAATLAAGPALAQSVDASPTRRDLVALQHEAESLRRRIGQLQLDALIDSVAHQAVPRHKATAPLTGAGSVRRMTIDDLL